MTRPSRFSLPRAFLCAATVAALGCNVLGGDSTDGDLGVARFEYSSGCFLDCKGVTRAMVAGTEESISAQLKSGQEPYAESANPAVFRVTATKNTRTCCTRSGSSSTCSEGESSDSCRARGGELSVRSNIDVVAVGPGEAKLRLMGANRALVDSVTLKVEVPATLDVDVAQGATGVPRLDLRVGEAVVLSPHARSADGSPLQATKGFVLRVDDTLVVGFRDTGFTLSSPRWSLQARAAGATTMHIVSGGLDVGIPVTVR